MGGCQCGGDSPAARSSGGRGLAREGCAPAPARPGLAGLRGRRGEVSGEGRGVSARSGARSPAGGDAGRRGPPRGRP